MHNGNGHSHSEGQGETPEDRIARLLREVAEKGKALFSEGVQGAREAIEKKAAVLRSRADEMGVEDVADDVKKYMRRHPWRSLGIAAGIGALVALFLNSNQRRDD